MSCLQTVLPPKSFCLQDVLPPNCPTSRLSCLQIVLPPGQALLPPSCPASRLPCLQVVLPPGSPASRLSCLQAPLPPSCPASKLSCLQALLPPLLFIPPLQSIEYTACLPLAVVRLSPMPEGTLPCPHQPESCYPEECHVAQENSLKLVFLGIQATTTPYGTSGQPRLSRAVLSSKSLVNKGFTIIKNYPESERRL